jgi:hypothetical protein
MIGRTKLLLVLLPSLALLPALPAAAPGKTVTYKGEITRGVPDYDGYSAPGGGAITFRVTFKGKPSSGKPVRLGLVQIDAPPWACEVGGAGSQYGTGGGLAENQRIRFGLWSPTPVWTRVDRVGQFGLATRPGRTLDSGVFRSNFIDGDLHGKKAKSATGELELEYGEPAPTSETDPDWPGDPSRFQCVVDHEWVAKRR